MAFKRFRNPSVESAITVLQDRAVQVRKFSFTGEDLKALCSDTSQASQTILLADELFPSDCVLLGAVAKVTSADDGTATTATLTLGSNSTAFTDLIASVDLRTAATTKVATTFVPLLASGTDLKGVLAVTGSGKDIDDIADDTAVSVYVMFAGVSEA